MTNSETLYMCIGWSTVMAVMRLRCVGCGLVMRSALRRAATDVFKDRLRIATLTRERLGPLPRGQMSLSRSRGTGRKQARGTRTWRASRERGEKARLRATPNSFQNCWRTSCVLEHRKLGTCTARLACGWLFILFGDRGAGSRRTLHRRPRRPGPSPRCQLRRR
ncbi:hypothetical protein FA95DRAFT_850479 [Auriscalpium vulgare]|uniref:Uncharacterized protein n=1 Tax=Auriscalpium vulgare TaxID=40419 RepID=A0ACB8R9H9_9AGAM|nr:hypothetical protein FA95DRAFT_850479 [Auriscalpium vulgare]